MTRLLFNRTLLIVLYCATTFTITHAQPPTNPERDALQARLKPVGQVHIEGQVKPKPKPEPEATPLTPEQRAEQIYEKSCITCHDAGVAGAPKLGDAAAWKERTKKGMDNVIKNAINGIKFMPAKGTCLECSDEDIALVVKYMVAQSK